MSFTLHGLGVSAGIAIGRAHLISQATLEVAHLTLAPRQVDKEIARFDAAVDAVRKEFLALKENAEHAPPELSAFIDVHLMFLADGELSAKPRQSPPWRANQASPMAVRRAPSRVRTGGGNWLPSSLLPTLPCGRASRKNQVSSGSKWQITVVGLMRAPRPGPFGPESAPAARRRG